MEQPLVDTKITKSQIEKWLGEYFHTEIKLKTCDAKKIADGEGFTSTILKVKLEYENGDEKYPKSVVVKTPSLPALEDLMSKLTAGNETDAPGTTFDEMVEFTTFGHTAECEAYRIFGDQPPIPLPIIYAATKCHANEMGAIVMEDLSDRSSIIGDPLSVLSLDQLNAAVDAMATWHAWCLTTNVPWQQHFEAADSGRRKEMFTNWFGMMKGVFERTKQKYPNVFTALDEGLAQKPFDMDEFTRVLNKHRAIMPDLIVHGDFYANNLMYETYKDEKGKVVVGSKLISIIDWALTHSGSPMEDLGRLLSLSVDTETRRRHTNDVLRRYYDKLIEKAGKEKVKATFEQIVEIYEDDLVMAGVFFVLMLDWLQNLFVREVGEEGERRRKILFERCLGVYEDILPIMAKAQPTG
jgi:hypothetical protein